MPMITALNIDVGQNAGWPVASGCMKKWGFSPFNHGESYSAHGDSCRNGGV